MGQRGSRGPGFPRLPPVHLSSSGSTGLRLRRGPERGRGSQFSPGSTGFGALLRTRGRAWVPVPPGSPRFDGSAEGQGGAGSQFYGLPGSFWFPPGFEERQGLEGKWGFRFPLPNFEIGTLNSETGTPLLTVSVETWTPIFDTSFAKPCLNRDLNQGQTGDTTGLCKLDPGRTSSSQAN